MMPASLHHIGTVLRHARFKHWPGLLPAALAAPLQPASPAGCEIASPEQYSAGREQLRALTGASTTRRCADLSRLGRFIAAQRGASGAIGVPDLLFLHAFVSLSPGDHAVEIGTLSGFSSAVIADALGGRGQSSSSVLVDTIDINDFCINDPDRRVGYAIPQIAPELPSRVRIHAGKDARVLPEIARPNEFDVAFIDGDHQHPRPLLDLLRVAPFVRRGGWVVLHDIALAAIALRDGIPGDAPRGAEWLWQEWPFAKISGGNIGAVKLPLHLADLVRIALAMLRLPTEVEGAAGARSVRATVAAAAALG